DADFDEFWSAYPRREAKKGARTKFAQAVKAGTSAATIVAGARRYAAYVTQVGREREKIKIPTTWLNNGCWDDELNGPTIAAPAKPSGDPADWLRERWQAGDAAAVARVLGERYERPDLPVHVDGKENIAAFWRTSARTWIEDHREAALAKLAEGVAA
ncbi:hypothetical protein, partial [Amycolatopsis stemonae]